MCSNSYTKVDNAILDDDKLPRSCKAVFIVLCRHAHNDDRSCWLCIKTIAKESSYSIRTVKAAVKKLVEAGLITRQDRFSEEDGGQISSLFTIIGSSAKRYEPTPPVQKLHAPQCNDCTHNKTPLTIKDSLTREEAPEAVSPEPESKPVDKAVNLSEVPEVMRSTAQYLLLKTKRESLKESELSSLRELSASQYPARVQKEIDKACERFAQKKQDLQTLSFNYIAGSLRNQPSRKLGGKKPSKPDMTQSEIAGRQKHYTEQELEELEKLLGEDD